jgi:hypothetical protein
MIKLVLTPIAFIFIVNAGEAKIVVCGKPNA